MGSSRRGAKNDDGLDPPCAAGGAVELYRNGQHIRVIPAVPGLHDRLHTVIHEPVTDPEFGHLVVDVPQRLLREMHDPEGSSSMLGWAGLEPMLHELLVALGHEVILTGKRPSPLADPDRDRLAALDPVDELLLELVRRHDRGLVRYDQDRVDPAHLIAQVALAWPRKKIVVTATRIDEARAVCARLRTRFSRVSLYTSRRSPSRSARIVVTTYNNLAEGAIGAEFRGVYVALDPTELFLNYQLTGIMGLRCLPRARFYGFLADGVKVAPIQRPLLLALFGLESIRIPRHGYRPLPVDVLFTRIAGGVRPPDHGSVLAIKRLGLWRHHVRNRWLARLFQLLAAGGRRTLRAQFPDVAAHVPGKPRGRIGLLVENLEHALVLARRLRVPVVAAEGIWTDGMAPEDVELLNSRGRRPRPKGHAIVTHEGLARSSRSIEMYGILTKLLRENLSS